MLDWSFIRIVTHTVEKGRRGVQKVNERERWPTARLGKSSRVLRMEKDMAHLSARTALVKDLVVSLSLNGSVLMHLEYISPDQNLAAYGSTYSKGSRATLLEFPQLNG